LIIRKYSLSAVVADDETPKMKNPHSTVFVIHDNEQITDKNVSIAA